MLEENLEYCRRVVPSLGSCKEKSFSSFPEGVRQQLEGVRKPTLRVDSSNGRDYWHRDHQARRALELLMKSRADSRVCSSMLLKEGEELIP